MHTGRVRILAATALALACCGALAEEVLVEAETFRDLGGWVVDPQFADVMGSPYLLAHGRGVPVADAQAEVTLVRGGAYHVWVRSKDWVPSHHPGRFKLLVNRRALAAAFGVSGGDWGWEYGGVVELRAGAVELRLHDLTGLDGRCDAVYLTTDAAARPPNVVGAAMAQWRRARLGLPETPQSGGEFDLVVVGGGVAGCAAAGARKITKSEPAGGSASGSVVTPSLLV